MLFHNDFLGHHLAANHIDEIKACRQVADIDGSGAVHHEAAQAIADVCTFLTSLPFAVWISRILTAKSQHNA